MPVTDVSAFIGNYPYRQLSNATPDWLLWQLDRMHVEEAWVGYLPALLQRDPRPGNEMLVQAVGRQASRLRPVPTIDPTLPGWEDDINAALQIRAPAIRAYPMHKGLDPAGGEMRVLAAALATAGLPLVLTVRFEDLRQRHPLDTTPDLPASAIRTLIRCDPEIRVLVTHADRAMVEEVHFGLTPGESRRVLWDFSWIWGPPENHLRLLFETVGVDRFTFGSGMPLRIPDAALAKLDLLRLTDSDRFALLGENLDRWRRS